MNVYIALEGDTYYPNGGGDIKGVFLTSEDAWRVLKNSEMDWTEVVKQPVVVLPREVPGDG